MNEEKKLLHAITCMHVNSPKYEEREIKELISKISINEFMLMVKRHKCLPILQLYKDLFNEANKNIIDTEYNTFLARCKRLKEIALSISNKVKKENIKIIEPKGIALSLLIYGEVEKRQFGDLDFIVNEKQISDFGVSLVELGWFHRHNGDISEICNVIRENLDSLVYEIKFYNFYCGNKYCVELKKASDAISCFNLQFLIDDLENVVMDNNIIYKRFSNEGMLLHLCSNIFTDHYKYEGIFAESGKFRNYIDLFYFLKNVDVDYKKFETLVVKCNLQESIFFCKAMMKELFDIKIFEEVNIQSNLKIPSIDIVLSQKIKEFFFSLYLQKQMEYDQKNNTDSNTYLFQLQDVNIIINYLGENNFEIKIMSIKGLLEIFNRRRLYLCLISIEEQLLEEKESMLDLDIESYYKNNQCICVYARDNNIYCYEDNINIFNVNNPTTENKKLLGKKVQDIVDNGNYIIDFNVKLSNRLNQKNIYFDAFFDLKLLKDYYKHDSFLYEFGTPLKRVR